MPVAAVVADADVADAVEAAVAVSFFVVVALPASDT